MNEKVGVVLLNLGGPDSLDAVEPFLFNLFSDPDIINFPLSFLFRKRLAKLISSKRHPRIQEQYKQIGGKSPLKDYTLRQASLLQQKLNEKISAKVYVAMRYWHPFTEEALDEIERDEIKKIILLPLYPQYSKATTVSSVKEWEKQVALKENAAELDWSLVESYYDFPPYIDAFVERVNQGLDKFPVEKRKDVYILFSAHGIPMKLVREGDPYPQHIEKTVEAVMRQGNFAQTRELSFQSKVGPQKWLKPSTPETIGKLAAQDVKNMLVVPIAFVSDHLETLFEVGIEFRHLAKEKGIEQFEVTEGLNDSDKFISALAELVYQNLNKTETKKAFARSS